MRTSNMRKSNSRSSNIRERFLKSTLSLQKKVLASSLPGRPMPSRVICFDRQVIE